MPLESNPNKVLIGIAGPARSGKDTVAEYLVKEFGYMRLAMADPLKDGLLIMLRHVGVRWEHLWGDKKEEVIPALGKSARQMFQTLGTDWGRHLVHPDLWIKVAEGRCPDLTSHVLSDVRFENEAAFVRRHGKLIHLHRPDAQKVNPHSSEAGVRREPGDLVITNDGTVEDLQIAVWLTLFGSGIIDLGAPSPPLAVCNPVDGEPHDQQAENP